MIEALIAIAVMTAAGLALAQMMSNFANLNRNMDMVADFNRFMSDINAELQFEERCRAILGDKVMNVTLVAGVYPKTPITMTIRGQTYDPAGAPINRYIFNDEKTALLVSELYLQRTSTAPVDVFYDNNPDPAVTNMVAGRKYVFNLGVSVQRDALTSYIFRRQREIPISAIVDATTLQIKHCSAVDGVAEACEKMGGVYDSNQPIAERCNLAPAMGGCLTGGSYTTSRTGSNPTVCSRGNPAQPGNTCSCPVEFDAYSTLNFTAYDTSRRAVNVHVFTCYKCDSTSVSPY